MIYDTVNPEIIKMILRAAKPGVKILDIGCGTGRLGQALKARLDCSITGIEVDSGAVSAAREIYDEVREADLEDLIHGRTDYKDEKKYDFIIYGDILEHISRPESLLQYFDKFLKDNGFVIASIPNVANWLVRLGLTFGKFDYSGGILDQGHLRFFTYRTARKLLEDSGYEIISVINNNRTWPIRMLGRVWKRMFAFQFVFKCRKRP
jgi:2-polyprenyl-3-methyl-5-hydroxy-6-metoxy-1,4-benzoquinol methylase